MSERLPMPEFSSGSTLWHLQNNGTLRVGAAPDCPGFSLLDESTGRFSGLDIAFARKLAQAVFGGSAISAMGKVQFVQVPVVDRVQVIESGRVDVVVSTFS